MRGKNKNERFKHECNQIEGSSVSLLVICLFSSLGLFYLEVITFLAFITAEQVLPDGKSKSQPFSAFNFESQIRNFVEAKLRNKNIPSLSPSEQVCRRGRASLEGASEAVRQEAIFMLNRAP